VNRCSSRRPKTPRNKLRPRNEPVDPDTLQELFTVFGPVKVHRIFGDAGLYADNVMFRLVSDWQIYLKADTATAKVFEREGCGPFEYRTKAGRRAVMS
jgi:DNA transformation protein